MAGYFKLAYSGSNLKSARLGRTVISRTLSLFHEFATGYTSIKLMGKLEIVKWLLRHHDSEHFPFLANAGNAKLRAAYYVSLSRLLFADDNVALDDDFVAFMAPFQRLLVQFSTLSVASAHLEQAKSLVVGVFRDLRGFSSALTTKKAFGYYYNWVMRMT